MNSWHYRVCRYLKHRWGCCSMWKTVTFFPSLRKSILKDPKTLIFETDSISRWIFVRFISYQLSKSSILMYLQYCSKVSWQSRLETWFSILQVFENRVKRLKFRVLIFEVREPSFKTLKEFFEDLEQSDFKEMI